ncbi:MAG: CapA family protein [Oscillospiraceae bacterium]
MNRFQSNMVTLAIAAVLMAGCWISIGTSGTSPSEREKSAAKKTDGSEISYSVISAEKNEDAKAEDPASDPMTDADRSAALTARVHVVAAGDNLIHSSLYKQAANRSDSGGYDFTYLYDNVDEFIANADIAILNQETLICNDTIEPSDYPYFNSPTALGDHMINIGFDVFTMANNHVLDHKEEGLSACLDYWDSHPEVTVLGAYRNEQDKENIRTMTSNGIEFSFLSYTESLNGLKLPDSSEMLIGNAYDVDGMVSDIKAAKKISDICIVSLHWGVEDSYVISDTQRDVAQQLADAGADVIVGTHPHVLRDIEMIDRKDGGQTLCAYSLGNFVSAQSEPRNLIGGVLDFYVDCFGDEYSIDDISLIPTIQHYDSGYANNRVYFYTQYTDELAAQHGVNSTSKFDMEYIDSVLDNTVSAEFLQKGSIV